MAAFAKFNRLKLTGVLSIDGKALRGAYERGKSATPIHMVNIFAAEARMALASRRAPGRNEAQGALEVLQTLCLKHCIITADALHCNRNFGNTVIERGGHYVLTVKKNQSKLFAAVERCFARTGTRSSAVRTELSTHDRRETRRATVMRNTTLAINQDFRGIVAIGRVTSRRRLHGTRAEKPYIRYYILSKYIAAKKLLHIVRSHWGVENRLHWMLDVIFGEDANRSRKDNAPENFAILRRIAINLVRLDPTPISMRQKIKTAGWDDSYLLKVLGHMR